MNYKLEKFWNQKSLEKLNGVHINMNYKLEKFWNGKGVATEINVELMNYKLKKFCC